MCTAKMKMFGNELTISSNIKLKYQKSNSEITDERS